MLKLNLGCGGNILDGYINIGFEDGRPDSGIYLNHDLSKGFPFPYESNCVDIIYNCHFLEHLEYKDGIQFLRNSCLAMKEGAIMRILVPDLELWCMKYLQHDRAFLDNYRNLYLHPSVYPTDASIFMGMLHNHEHKMGWDFETLHHWLTWAGFKSIRKTKYRESDLKDIERLEPINHGRELESLCVECYK
jgi:predicted SAM-dependent methyltransferase